MQIKTILPFNSETKERVRVAAYARVSADKTEAFHSLEQQVDYYNKMILKHPDWTLHEIYVDEAVSGTREDRREFLRMMEDARQKRFKLLIVKSVTRLARNTVTFLNTLRELKDLEIRVYFENENIYSDGPDGELMLTMLALYAEEEARSASLNKRWQIKRRYEEGDPIYIRMYGYKWEDGKLVIVPEEAEVVRRIFELYLAGRGPQFIAKIIREEQAGDGRRWSVGMLHKILRNEKYKGDLLLQKTHIPDFRDKKKYNNKGQWTQYLVPNAHPAIIPPELFDQVQEEIIRRKKRKIKTGPREEGEPLFKGMLVCGNCKGQMVRKKSTSAKDERYVWMCRRYLREGKKVCPSKRIHETLLIQKTKEVLGFAEERELIRTELLERVDYIEVRPDQKLRFILRSGRVETVSWETMSRSRSWTKEMREEARLRGRRQAKRRRA